MAAENARWRRPTSLFLLFLSLACLAFGSLRRYGGTTGSVLEDAYHSIGIFTANGSWAFDPANHVNTLFKFLATATPVVTFIGFVELLTGGILPFFIRLRTVLGLRLGWHGTVVCGLNNLSLQFAEAVTKSGSRALILDDSPMADLARRSYRRNIPVLPLRSLQKPGFANLLFRQCDLFSFLPSTDRQVDLVAQIDARMAQPSEKSFWFLVQERGLAQRLDSYLRFTAGNSALRPRFFDIDALAARQVLSRHPLDVLADAANQQQIHLAILGFGALGRAIVKEAARSVVTLPSIAGVKLKVTVIDMKAAEAACALEAEDPQIGQVLDLQVVSLTLQPAGLLEKQLHDLPDNVTAYFVTIGNPELAFATAVSLRHWLLEPPTTFEESWRHTHPCVPIMIRLRNWEGLGRLIRSNVDWPGSAERAPELPDGIFGFGVSQDVLDPAFIMSAARETGARVLHQSYRTTGEASRRLAGGAEAARVAERDWRELATDLRDLNLYGFDHIAMKARAIGHRVVPGATTTDVPATVLPMLEKLSRLEHCRYFAERAAGGWRRASTRCDELRLHPAMVDWADLPDSEKRLDENHIRAVFQALAASGQRMLKTLVIAVIGQNQVPREAAAAALRNLLQAKPETAPVILTTMAPGAGMIAAETALALGIPWIAILPLPFELYRETFSLVERRRLQALISYAERYIELPLRFGRASDLTGGLPQNLARRARQHALATAFMIERAHALVVLGEPEDESMGRWTEEQPIPAAYRSGAAFLPRPSERLPVVFVGEDRK
jgi:hypothetical protein